MRMNVRLLVIVIYLLFICYNVQPVAVAVRAASSGCAVSSSKSPTIVTKVCVCKNECLFTVRYDF
jgi:hypothetical protein